MKTLKLTCLSILLLGSALHAMESQPDSIELGKQLAQAASERDWPTVEKLIAQKADLNQKDNYGLNALMTAARECRPEIAKMLIDAHADLNKQDDNGWTALMIAAYSNHPKIAKMLIDAHANLNLQNAGGQNAFMTAAREGHPEIAKMLIDAMIAHPIDPSLAPKALTDEKKNLLHVAGLSLLKTEGGKALTRDTRQLILKRLANSFRQQNFIREQINRIENQAMRAQLLAYFESKIRSENEQKK